MNYYRIAVDKYKQATRIGAVLRYIPFVRVVAVVNSLSFNSALETSDVDLFVITKKGRIWTVRFFSTILLMALGLRLPVERRQNDAHGTKVCMAFFITEDNLNVEQYKICARDPYLIEWMRHVAFLYTEDNLAVKFFQANQWATGDAVPYMPNYKRRITQSVFKPLINLISMCVSERACKYVQLKKFSTRIRQLACAWDTRVIISDRVLKFHLNDRRLDYSHILCL